MVTKEEFESYIRVQQEGKFNMFDPNARLLTGLDKDTYKECMKKYTELHDKYIKKLPTV